MDCGAHALTYPSDIENPATEPALSRSSMLVLPVELVVNILSAVDFRSLLACRRVSADLFLFE
jgi:hypothetical protein